MNRQERRRLKKQPNSGNGASGITPNIKTQTLLDTASELYAADQLDEAAELCLDASAGAPLEAEPFHLLALIRYRQGRLPDAGDNILEAITRNDDNPEIHANCGAIMNMLGRHPEAEAACRHVIDLKPKNPEAHNNLAVALEMQGRVEEAKVACRTALKFKSDYPEALINLGNLHTRSGDYISGVETYAKAITLAPENPMARANLSVALLRLEQPDEALEQAEQALSLSPEYVEALNAVGNAHLAKTNFTQAESAFRKAHTQQPAHREAGLNLAATLHKLGRSDDAAEMYDNILKSNPDLAEAENGLGVVLLATGRIKDAISAFRRAIAGPGTTSGTITEAYYNLASSGAGFDEQELAAIHTLLKKPSLTGSQQTNLHFALADQADKSGAYGDAMAHMEAGNRLRKKTLKRNEIEFDADTFDQEITDIINVFSKKLMFDQNSLGHASGAPVFICGMPRSGTTLLEQIISSHPQVQSVGERGAAMGLLEDHPLAVQNLDADQAAVLHRALLERLWGTGDQAKRIIDKSPFNLFFIGLIHILFPRAHIIHCQRDPLDTGLSCYAQNFVGNHPWSTDLTDIGRYSRAQSRMMDHWRETLKIPMHVVRYEYLVADQEQISRQVIEFLGLEWDDACLRYFDNGHTVLSASNWQVRQPLYSSSVGKAARYRDHLKDLDVALRCGS